MHTVETRSKACAHLMCNSTLTLPAQVYRNITRSIAPGVHGHEDVKRAIALMLFGGVHKQTSEVLLPPCRALLCAPCLARPS